MVDMFGARKCIRTLSENLVVFSPILGLVKFSLRTQVQILCLRITVGSEELSWHESMDRNLLFFVLQP